MDSDSIDTASTALIKKEDKTYQRSLSTDRATNSRPKGILKVGTKSRFAKEFSLN